MRRVKVFGAGYTLIELIVVMLVISILGATVMLRMSTASDRAAMTHADQLRRDFAHAQALALSWGVSLRFSIAADKKSYSFICRATAVNTPCTVLNTKPIDPATGAEFSVTLAEGVLISPGAGTLDFDSMGRPISGSTLLSASNVYTVSGAAKTVTVTVQPITGFAAAN